VKILKKQQIIKILIILLEIILLVIAIFAYKFIYTKEINKVKYAEESQKFVDENKEPIFKIDKIILYNSANGIDNSDGKLQSIDISQFTDIVIYLNNTNKIKEITAENTINQMYIDNIKITSKSENGEKILNYKNPYNSGKYQDLKNYENNGIYFKILNSNEKNNSANYDEPVFYTDCSNPISLGFINKNILTNCEVTDTGSISFDGSILKAANIDVKDLKTTLDFTIHLKNNFNEEFTANVSLDIDLEKENEAIYTGYMMQIFDSEEIKFLKVSK